MFKSYILQLQHKAVELVLVGINCKLHQFYLFESCSIKTFRIGLFSVACLKHKVEGHNSVVLDHLLYYDLENIAYQYHLCGNTHTREIFFWPILAFNVKVNIFSFYNKFFLKCWKISSYDFELYFIRHEKRV